MLALEREGLGLAVVCDALLRLSDVAWAQPLPLIDGSHKFPAGVIT